MAKPTQIYFVAGAVVVILVVFLTTSWHNAAHARTADARLRNFIDTGPRTFEPMFFANPHKDINPYHEPLNPFPLLKADRSAQKDQTLTGFGIPQLQRPMEA